MKKLLVAVIAALLLYPTGVMAFGECGMACCVAGATGSGATLAENFGVALLYENSYMKTIRKGTGSVSPSEAIADNQQPMNGYSVPTEMVMQKYTLTVVRPIDERLMAVAFVPYLINDMDMRMRSAMGMDMEMTMDTVSGLGDISVMALYTAYTDAPIRPTKKLTIGAGIKSPTGATDEKKPNGARVHAMMQTGSGSWDALFLANYMRAYYPLVLQANLFYQLTTESRDGYEFGNQLAIDLVARYQVADYINLGVELNGINSERDKDHDGKFSSPVTSMVDNTDNTGLTSVLFSPSLQVKIPNSSASFELKYQTPIYQDVNGYQQVLDRRLLASLSFAF